MRLAVRSGIPKNMRETLEPGEELPLTGYYYPYEGNDCPVVRMRAKDGSITHEPGNAHWIVYLFPITGTDTICMGAEVKVGDLKKVWKPQPQSNGA
jgi:hypothetical protein